MRIRRRATLSITSTVDIKENDMNIIRYMHRRRVRRLAERILSNQPAYGSYDNRVECVRGAISTAEQFYHEWEKGGAV